MGRVVVHEFPTSTRQATMIFEEPPFETQVAHTLAGSTLQNAFYKRSVRRSYGRRVAVRLTGAEERVANVQTHKTQG